MPNSTYKIVHAACMNIDGKYKRSCMHAACTLLAVARGIPWEEFTCKWDFNSCIIYVTFLSCSYIQFLLYVVLLFKQPQLLLMAIDYYLEQRYFLTRRENNSLSVLGPIIGIRAWLLFYRNQ
jgi:hypothetical protein